MRPVAWLLGMALGIIAGAAMLEVGVLALLLIVPAIVWAGRERARPLGLGGLVAGLGAGMAGLILMADARCAASNGTIGGVTTGCVSPDPTGYLVAAGAIVAIGLAVSLFAVTRGSGGGQSA
jgi:hypothetical protein